MSQQFEPLSGRTPSPLQENNEEGQYSSNFAASSSLERRTEETGASPPHHTARRFDWPATGIVVSIAAIFTLAARLEPQPATSFVPVAVLSATGYGLLITALRKLRAGNGVGLGEAALAGFSIALFQWIIALSYPGVISSLSNVQLAGPGFFTTWGLVAFFSVLFSIIGATLGHMAFAPPRPLPARTSSSEGQPAGDDEAAEEQVAGETTANTAERQEDTSQEGPAEEEKEAAARPVMSFVIAILLLGLAPILVGYVFAGSFDFALNHFGYDPGPFSTLRLLSALLPWQIPVPITLSGANGVSTIITLLWRIPLFFGNPSLFDIQALEPFVFNATGLALLLLLCQREESSADTIGMSWGRLLIFEGLLGLLLVVPADLWIMQGLQGVLQIQSTVLPIGTLNILNTPTFTLNIITGPLICMVAGTLISRLRPVSPLPATQAAQPTGE